MREMKIFRQLGLLLLLSLFIQGCGDDSTTQDSPSVSGSCTRNFVIGYNVVIDRYNAAIRKYEQRDPNARQSLTSAKTAAQKFQSEYAGSVCSAKTADDNITITINTDNKMNELISKIDGFLSKI